MPRMTSFRTALPEIDLWLDTSERKVDFETDEVDILITQASGVAGQETSEADLIADARVALAAPQLIARMEAIGKPRASLEGWPLLHDESHVTWREWFRQSEIQATHSVKGANFSDHALMLDAAVAGHGVAIGSMVCAETHLRSGALVQLGGPTFPQPPYRIYRARVTIDEDHVRRVYDWLRQEGGS